MKGRAAQIAGIVLPILVIAFWISTYVFSVRTGRVVRLQIEGFDPRDLLSGHYLRYNVQYGMDIPCQNKERRTVCFTPGDDGIWTVDSNMTYDASPSCDVFLHGTCRYSRFEAGIERYYFPEEFKRQLAVVPPASTIDVAITPDGKGIVKALHVDGQPVLEWVREQPEKKD